MAKKVLFNSATIDYVPKEPPPGLTPIGFKPIKVTKLEKPISSQTLITAVSKYGMDVRDYPLRLFNEGKFGKQRRLDNLDMIRGYPFFNQDESGVSSQRQLISELRSFSSDFLSDCEAVSPALFDMENEDINKFSILRPTMPGRHMQAPINLDLPLTAVPEDFKSLLRRVIREVYVPANSYHKAGREAMLDGTDAKDTALGSPTFYAGEDYHAVRKLTCQCIPVPDYSKPPSDYLKSVEAKLGIILPEPSMVYASYLSYRQGAISKPLPLWEPYAGGWQANYEAYGIYTRQRAVWAAPFWLNVLVTPLVLRMKSSRQHILGMWHTPELQAKYIPVLKSQGTQSIEIDYSSYDTTIRNEILFFAYTELAKAGYSPWEANLMADVTLRGGAIAPSWSGDVNFVTYFKHKMTLLSGLLTTSEMGSIISISLVLYALEKQRPDLVRAWFSRKFVILVQSDDVTFTYSGDLNQEAFTSDLSRMGITAKVKAGSTFLKRFLPLMPFFPRMTKPFGRNFQQTVANEDDLSGKPNAILRLGFAARSEGLQFHPLFKKYWPKLMGLYESHLSFIREGPTKDWLSGRFVITAEDVRAIQMYAETQGGKTTLTNLIERASFDPSAALVLNYLKASGLSLDFLISDQVTARREYVNSIFSNSTSNDLFALSRLSRWNS